MRTRLAILLLPFLLVACGDGNGDAGPAPDVAAEADSAAGDSDAARADSAKIVLLAGPLRLSPAGQAPAVTDVGAGTTLRVVGDTTTAAGEWIRLATWDDRTGWMPAGAVLDAGLWTHYAEALGGVAPVGLRPAYPIGEGRWAAEKPFPSPDLDPPTAVWLAGDSLLSTRAVELDTMSVECTGARHSLAVLERADAGGERRGARLEDGALAIPASREPTARALAVGPLEPEPELRRVVERAARAELEAGPRATVPEDAEALPTPDDEPRVEWRTAGPDAAWAVVYWNPFEGREAEIMPGRWGAAFLAVRADGGWTVRTVLPLDWAFVGPEAPPWRLLSAVATVPERPTLLAVEVVEYEGARIDLYLADDEGFRRLYRGFYWGC